MKSNPPAVDLLGSRCPASGAQSAAAGCDAPTYTIPRRKLAAVEHPMIIKDLDKGIRTFGSNPSYDTILDSASPQTSVALFVRDSPAVRPYTSHNAAVHNVLLKVTVPKRTGRKRKRGSVDPFEAEAASSESADSSPSPEALGSVAGRNDPCLLRRMLQDNVGRYHVETVGAIKHTHRYRGFADFQYSMSNDRFTNRFISQVLPAQVPKLRDFKLEPGHDVGPNIPIVPPPLFSHQNMGHNYFYSQNPYVRAQGDGGDIVNVTARVKTPGYFITLDEYPAPARPKMRPDMSNPAIAELVTLLQKAMDVRPIWTRRSIVGYLRGQTARPPEDDQGPDGNNTTGERRVPALRNGNLIKFCIPFVGYQINGGPWRDALIRYGIDPRTDPQYRIYQTISFQISKPTAARKQALGAAQKSWQDIRRADYALAAKNQLHGDPHTYIFDGKTFGVDGKVWQVCDITDPLLARLFGAAEVRHPCETAYSGWYRRGLWAKAKAVMKTKMTAITFGRPLADDDFAATLAVPDATPRLTAKAVPNVPVPSLNLTPQERLLLTGRATKERKEERKKRRAFSRPLSPGSRLARRKTAADRDREREQEQERAALGPRSPSASSARSPERVDPGLELLGDSSAMQLDGEDHVMYDGQGFPGIYDSKYEDGEEGENEEEDNDEEDGAYSSQSDGEQFLDDPDEFEDGGEDGIEELEEGFGGYEN